MPDDLLIGDRLTFGNAVTLRNVSNLRCSWEISRIGLLSCDVPLRDLPAGLMPPQSMLRKWVQYVHPSAGVWGGVISSVSVTNGIVTLDCESWASMLRGVVTRNVSGPDVVTALQQAIANAAPYTGITFQEVALPTPGEPGYYAVGTVTADTSFYGNGQDLYDAFLPAVIEKLYDEHAWKAGLRGLAWNIDPATRKFRADFTYGTILTNTVVVRDQVHSADSGWTDDVEDISNYVYLTARYNAQVPTIVDYTYVQEQQGGLCNGWAGKRKNRHCISWTVEKGHYDPVYQLINTTQAAVTVEAFDLASINAYGRREVNVRQDTIYPDYASLQFAAQSLAADSARNEQIVTVETVNENLIWRDFREGDMVAVDLANNARTGNMIVRNRAYDATRGTMLVAGEAQLNV